MLTRRSHVRTLSDTRLRNSRPIHHHTFRRAAPQRRTLASCYYSRVSCRAATIFVPRASRPCPSTAKMAVAHFGCSQRPLGDLSTRTPIPTLPFYLPCQNRLFACSPTLCLPEPVHRDCQLGGVRLVGWHTQDPNMFPVSDHFGVEAFLRFHKLAK